MWRAISDTRKLYPVTYGSLSAQHLPRAIISVTRSVRPMGKHDEKFLKLLMWFLAVLAVITAVAYVLVLIGIIK